MNAHFMHHGADRRGQGLSCILGCLWDASHAPLLRSPRVGVRGAGLRLARHEVWAAIRLQLCHFSNHFFTHPKTLPC